MKLGKIKIVRKHFNNYSQIAIARELISDSGEKVLLFLSTGDVADVEDFNWIISSDYADWWADNEDNLSHLQWKVSCKIYDIEEPFTKDLEVIYE